MAMSSSIISEKFSLSLRDSLAVLRSEDQAAVLDVVLPPLHEKMQTDLLTSASAGCVVNCTMNLANDLGNIMSAFLNAVIRIQNNYTCAIFYSPRLSLLNRNFHKAAVREWLSYRCALTLEVQALTEFFIAIVLLCKTRPIWSVTKHRANP
jgi:hypothetical protein